VGPYLSSFSLSATRHFCPPVDLKSQKLKAKSKKNKPKEKSFMSYIIFYTFGFLLALFAFSFLSRTYV
jgi:hypothetical protein